MIKVIDDDDDEQRPTMECERERLVRPFGILLLSRWWFLDIMIVVMTSSLMPSVRMSVSSWHGSPSSDTIFITKQANTSSSTRIRAIVLWPGKCEWRRVEPM